jgi:CubicO group peptidase (beta-lactamase class C family)
MIKFKIVFLFILLVGMSSCQIGRFVFYNFADIKDNKKFPKRDLIASSKPFEFIQVKEQRKPKELKVGDKKMSFEEYLESQKTVAFLIIRNDSLLYDNYFNSYNKESEVPSFSVAKSVTSILIGIAIQEGKITSIEDPITKYLPEMKDPKMKKVKIRHLLDMTSGIDYNESYVNPLGDAAAFYYGRKLRTQCAKMKCSKEPGTEFYYSSGNSQLLGLILDHALAPQTVTSYLQEKLWTPLQMQYPASWSIDKKKNGMEKTFCCLNTKALDYAKIGRLYLNKGNWNGVQIINENWVKESTKSEENDGRVWYYNNQWWIPSKEGDFVAHGILGQYIYVNPAKNLIMVRLGKSEGKMHNWFGFFVEMAKYY